MRIIHELKQNWKYTPADAKNTPLESLMPDKWFPATVPGTIHTDLIDCGLIPDPFYADNEKHLQWIAQNNWIYQTEFEFPQSFENGKTTYLIFKGLDSIAEIYLNEELIGRTENMFITYRFDITARVKAQKNKLKILFKSAVLYGRELIEQHGELFSARWPERSYIRKAQYSFGWDWGPAYPTMGIWQTVFLEQNTGITIEACTISTFQLHAQQAKLMLELELAGRVGIADHVFVEMLNDKQCIETKFAVDNQLMIKHQFTVTDPDLWWPRGYGEQNLYDLKVSLRDKSGNILDQWSGKTGIRTVELDLGDEEQRAFRFLVNDEPVYMKGANWIPADSFITRISHETYKTLITSAYDAGMNMLRVWGGGIYEQNIFYQLCDEMGIMVWQDFMFACATYWEDPDYLASVGIELKQNIQRLQHHPSIALWCGNNENEWIWYREGMGSITEMPGFRIFHEILPDLVLTYDPYRTYWPTSPFGEEKDPNNEFSGNRHSWDIWSHWVDYDEVAEDRSLFVTEFGFQAPANRDTLDLVIPENERNPQSEIFEFHNKQTEGTERLFRFLAGHLPVRTDWADFIYLTQLNQGLALKVCLEHWRHRWPDTSGSIIWQLNDCWPVCSWSLLDSALKPKLAYYFVRDAFNPLHFRFIPDADGINIHILCDVQENPADHVFIMVMDPETGEIKYDVTINVKGNYTTKTVNNVVSNEQLPGDEKWIVFATMYDAGQKVLCRNYYTVFNWKHIKLKNAKLDIRKKENVLTLKADTLVLFADPEHPRGHFDNRGFNLLPGEEYNLKFIPEHTESIDLSKLKIHTLNELWVMHE